MSQVDQLLQEGLQAFENKEFTKAMEIAKQLQQEYADSPEGYHFEGLIHQTYANWDESIVAFSKAIGESPYDPNLYNFRGFAYLNNGEMRKAEKDFKEAIELDDFEPAHRNFVLWQILNDRIDEAVEYLTERIKQKPDDAENLMLMGDLLSRAGYAENAQTYYVEAEKLIQKLNKS